MKIALKSLSIINKRSVEEIAFSKAVTFLYGPVSTGKSTVARLIDYCFGGELERTPAIQQEFVSVTLSVVLGNHDCIIERASDDRSSVRISWFDPDGFKESVQAPLKAQDTALIHNDVFNLSDLIFHLCGVKPIKVRQRTNDTESQLKRLSFRDIWWYCYLDQMRLDSSFFRFEDPFRGRKSQDAMRFFTGLHSELLSQLDEDLIEVINSQRAKREAVRQIRAFMEQFNLGSEENIGNELESIQKQISQEKRTLYELEAHHTAQTHPTDDLRGHLRILSAEIERVEQALVDSDELISEQKSLRSELITTKLKLERTHQAGTILGKVSYHNCPECGTDVSTRTIDEQHCRLCGSLKAKDGTISPQDIEVARRDLNERIDQLSESLTRREQARKDLEKELNVMLVKKQQLDNELQVKLARYDSAFLASSRNAERRLAALEERSQTLTLLQRMPEAINQLEEEAGALQGTIDRLRTSAAEERKRLSSADTHIHAIESEFKRILMAVSYPGVSEDDQVDIDPRNWRPMVTHGDQIWSFWDTGSGGKKTLFNVCYALAIHSVALELNLPVPSVLIIDSPTKNISEDENPELVKSLYAEIYQLATTYFEKGLQFLLIDSDLVMPQNDMDEFSVKRMAGKVDAPSLISYYQGP